MPWVWYGNEGEACGGGCGEGCGGSSPELTSPELTSPDGDGDGEGGGGDGEGGGGEGEGGGGEGGSEGGGVLGDGGGGGGELGKALLARRRRSVGGAPATITGIHCSGQATAQRCCPDAGGCARPVPMVVAPVPSTATAPRSRVQKFIARGDAW